MGVSTSCRCDSPGDSHTSCSRRRGGARVVAAVAAGVWVGLAGGKGFGSCSSSSQNLYLGLEDEDGFNYLRDLDSRQAVRAKLRLC